jgi:hypothetical protein
MTNVPSFVVAVEREVIFRRVLTAAVFLCLLSPHRTWSQTQETNVSKPIVGESVAPQVYQGTLRELVAVRAYKEGDPVRVIEDLRESGGTSGAENPSGTVSPQVANVDLSKLPAVQPYKPGDPVRVVPADTREGVVGATAVPGTAGPLGAPVSLGVGFDGIPATGFLPPDVAGAVGPNHYILMVNVAFAIFDKQGNILAGPAPINALWTGFGGPCTNLDNGDPIVRYDHLADRWLLSQFALPGGPQGFHECVAISRTPDPVAGGWFLYDFPMLDAAGKPVFPDYPKIGVWPDAYYMGTQRGFPGGGLDVWAFEREKMLNGSPARQVHFFVGAPSLFLLPADLDGPSPAVGTPNFFIRHVDGARFGGASRLELFAFHVDWSNPAFSSFSLAASLPTTFNSKICQGSFFETCIPQPGTSVQLEALSVWTMWRLQFRDFGTHQSLVTNHTVNNGRGVAAVRWYELRRQSGGGAWTIFQDGTHSPDANFRWMGSAGMNKAGTLALGYSVSSNAVFPSIRFADRLATDPPGTMGTEVNLIAGGGVQTFGIPRWGNYTTMDVDPSDDCTFWYAGEYMPSTSPAGWRTRISSLKDPACGKVTYMYPAKLLCGIQKEHQDTRFARGFYATSINIHNPNDAPAVFSKKLALSIPPGAERPGKIIPIAREKLLPDEAMEVDCEDIARRLFPSGLPAPLIEGFVVVESDSSLDVTAVYTTAALDDEGRKAVHQNGIEVERVPERKITQ